MGKSRKELVEFLLRHRTYTETYGDFGFERNVKLHSINIPYEIVDEAYELIEETWVYNQIESEYFKPFAERNKGYEMKFAGRSDGHIFLCHKSGDAGDRSGRYRTDDWSNSDIQELVNVVKDFDKTVDEAIKFFIDCASSLKVQKTEAANEAAQEQAAREAPAFAGVS